MSDLSTISVMFEELKQILKRVESNSTKPESSVKQDVISTSDLANITNQVSQSEELILQKFEQLEQAQTAPKKVHHRISIDITSSRVFIIIMVIGHMLLVSLFFHYRQREVINNLSDNDLKYRYIKAFNKADSVSVYKLEDIFEYNRDSKVIKEIRESVERYEQEVIDRAKRMEQAKLKEEEAKRLQNEASKLKSKQFLSPSAIQRYIPRINLQDHSLTVFLKIFLFSKEYFQEKSCIFLFLLYERCITVKKKNIKRIVNEIILVFLKLNTKRLIYSINMASLSYREIEETLKKELKEKKTSAEELPYILLQAFGMTPTSTERIRSGKMNLAKDGSILVKKKLAYKTASTEQLLSILEQMKVDERIKKATPRILAVSDGESILAYDPKENESYDNKIGKIWLDFQFFYPLAGVEKFRAVSENIADIKAAEKMAKLYDEIRLYNEISSQDNVHDLNIFMSRLLFCFFAEDTGIFEENLFTASIKRFTKDDGSDLSEYLDASFNIMDESIRVGVSSAIKQFPYVNGGLFKKRIKVPHLGYKARRIILDCGELNWSEINPDIFGSMIQAVVSPDMRAGLGMHYTSVPNIMKLIGPLFLNDLYSAFDDAKNDRKKLDTLLIRISKMKFFDPACGSGNFLIIAYKELRKLEIQIWQRIRELTKQATIPFVNVQIQQFYGIELDDYCAETAILSLWLAEHQMNKQFSKEFDVKIQALPLKASGNVVCANACRINWEDVCPHTKDDEVFIMGNPPYLGARLQDELQKQDMGVAMGNVRNYKNLDYVACWFYLGAKYILSNKGKCAFVSTNSICQGEQVNLLWTPILNMGIEIGFAHTSVQWSNNAKANAAVFFIIVGLQNQQEKGSKIIYTGSNTNIASNISPYLVNGSNIIVKSRSKSFFDVPEMVFGNMANDDGAFFLTKEEVEKLKSEYPSSSKFIRRVVGSQEFIRGEERYCLWITENDVELAHSIPEILHRIKQCEQVRLNSTREATRKLANQPWRFGEVRHKDTEAIIIPRVSSERRKYYPIGYLPKEYIITDRAFVIYDADLLILGLISSNIHMVWMKAVVGRLKMDYNYSSTLCYNTFPFPKITEDQKKAIEAAAEEVLLVRAEYPEKTLAELYDPDKMPQNLRDAHQELDTIVESCYCKEAFANDEERLEHLFKLYEKMTKKK